MMSNKLHPEYSIGFFLTFSVLEIAIKSAYLLIFQSVSVCKNVSQYSEHSTKFRKVVKSTFISN